MKKNITHFYCKYSGKKKSQNKRKIKGWKNCEVKIQTTEQWRDKKCKNEGEILEECNYKVRENVGNKWMMWPLIWRNKSVLPISVTLQLLNIYIYIYIVGPGPK